MNDAYINYIDQLLDLAERNDIFCLTSRAFNGFAVEVRETMAKGKPMKLEIDGEFDLLCAGCWRVLKKNGTLVMKWNEQQIKTSDVLKAIGRDPHFGDRKSKTRWLIFFKGDEE